MLSNPSNSNGRRNEKAEKYVFWKEFVVPRSILPLKNSKFHELCGCRMIVKLSPKDENTKISFYKRSAEPINANEFNYEESTSKMLKIDEIAHLSPPESPEGYIFES
ncbi:unnamed protein product [Blepharisma stoltei]|uniref:Uncharacterized protein n=1 Tax=Blepharisma stoltei TaxID=1481888 RepID=A0AAU9K9J3_9CILI|nr:unnamed protein product [Blepharisma stoltei]